MDQRIKCLNELDKLKKKAYDTKCAHLIPQLEKLQTAITGVLTMIDDAIFNTKKPTPRKYNRVKK